MAQGVRDLPMTAVVLDRTRVVTVVGEPAAGGVVVRLRLHGEAARDIGAGHQLSDGRGRQPPAALTANGYGDPGHCRCRSRRARSVGPRIG
jgi:hypothetical protein